MKPTLPATPSPPTSPPEEAPDAKSSLTAEADEGIVCVPLPPEVVEESLHLPTVVEGMNETMARLLQQQDKLTAIVNEDNAEQAMPVAALQALETESDIYMIYDIRLYAKSGEVVKLRGSSSFPDVVSQELLTEAVQNFAGTFDNNVVRPLMQKFMRYVSRFVQYAPTTIASGRANDMSDARLLMAGASAGEIIQRPTKSITKNAGE